MLCDSKWLCDLVDWKMMCCNYGEPMSQYCCDSVLQSTTQYDKYCKVLEQSTTQYDSVLQSTTKCYPVLIRLIVATHETSSTLRGATYGMQNAMELRHSCLIVATHETSFTLRKATGVTLQHHQILCAPWKVTVQNMRENGVICSARPIRDSSENEPVSPQPARQLRLLFALATCIFYRKIQHFALRLSFQFSANTAPATKSDSWTSPSLAPAARIECVTWMQLHPIRRLPRKVTVELPQIATKLCVQLEGRPHQILHLSHS